MTWIMYSDTVPVGRYWNGPGETGGCIEVVYKEKTEKYLDDANKLAEARLDADMLGSSMPLLPRPRALPDQTREPYLSTPPPPEVKGVGERWDRIEKSLETIAEALEGIYELLNRR